MKNIAKFVSANVEFPVAVFSVLLLIALATASPPQEKVDYSKTITTGELVINEAIVEKTSSEAQEVATGFQRAANRAIQKLARQGKITRREALRLRVSMLSPAFRNHAEELAIVQIYYSGDEQTDDYLPLNSDGRVDRTAIDWEGLTAFLEKFIPLLLQLLEIFGGV